MYQEHTLHIPSDWLFPSSLQEAAKAQLTMAAKITLEDQFGELNYIAGMDVSNNPRDSQQLIYASIVLLDNHCQKLLDTGNVVQKQQFPYIPGFLGFREAPALVAAYQQLKQKPDIIFVDGHGVSHPRGLGIASHLGILLNCPTIGVAKSLLVGKPATELDMTVNAQTPVLWQGKTTAMLLRTKKRSHPLIISSGHRVSLTTAVELVKQYLRGYRLPEPTRLAHLAANQYRKLQRTL